MREAFHDELDGISLSLLQMASLVKEAMGLATKALLNSDLALAEKIIQDDSIIDNIQHELDARTISLMARQQPVASDLRTLVTSLRMSADLERMGDLAHHVAKQARMRYPNCAVPAELTGTIEEMGRVAVAIIDKLSAVMEHRDIVRAVELETDDDEMDRLHRKLISTLLDDNWQHGVEAAIDMTLLGRYYERCADHAVSIARRVYFLVTGEYNNASND
ncbi:MAG: phosphate signaling complex protein PhoU [Actinobacteria bacterium]|nr:phosphate signaling complex protein PhoU [Actinomycetota bacterium]MSW15250.1 phosphate signaling complex protein PhoU [Actinomycetota bacterium]MSW98817.1 phosphate signaling complex protein PhoU [Actinomycetota bacterium]MSY82885.1 phosphate signaling complex protein PhoU [Actinomycetota bacterium]MSZ45938.1 phosphate signaling complex protein PhoU [Actinomycetota bacterium]